MNYTQIFEAYYNLYRADATTPGSTDAEYTIGLRLANEAINRWARYDGVFWKELYDTNQSDGTGAQTITTGTTAYAAPTNMERVGGFIKINNSDGKLVQTYRILEPEDVQFKDDNSTYSYFTGDPNNGFTLNLNPAPTSSINGMDIDYVYYKKPTQLTTGTDVSEMSNPYFIVHRMLANRLRNSRNPHYQSAFRDAEEALKIMKIENDAGNPANPWSVVDRSGSTWGD